MSDGLLRTYFNRSGSNDVNVLRPADIILFEVYEIPNSPVSHFQSLMGYPSPANRVVHAAIYLEHGILCHAVPSLGAKRLFGGIVLQRAWDLLQRKDRRVYVLRDEKISMSKRREIALYAATRSLPGSTYDWKTIINLLMSLIDSRASMKGSRELYNKLHDELTKWFLLGKTPELTDRQKVINSRVREPSEIFGTRLEEALASEDKLGLFKDSGIASFVCSDLITHCYNFILQSSSPFLLHESLLPILAPADVFLTTRLNSVAGANSVDAVVEADEMFKKAQ